MNKLFFLFLCFSFSFSGMAQVEQFIVPKENNGFYDKKVFANDSIIILETEAHILSVSSYEAYQKIKENYIICLEEREEDIISIEKKLTSFDQTLNAIISDLEKQNYLSEEVLKKTELELNSLLSEMHNDINNLNAIQVSIDEADKKLQEIDKKLKKERAKLFWRKIGDLIVVGGLGLLIGAAFLGG